MPRCQGCLPALEGVLNAADSIQLDKLPYSIAIGEFSDVSQGTSSIGAMFL